MKGKTNFKIAITTLAVTLMMIFTLAFSVSAESADFAENSEITDENSTVLPDNVGNELQNDDLSAEKVVNGENELKNIFADIYSEITKYTTEIVSVITLIGTLILSIAYKKGLLPIVTRSIGSIQQAVSKIKDDTESGAQSTKDGLDSVSERIGEVEGSLKLFQGTLDSLEAKLECEAEYVKERKKMSTVMLSQIDLLYDIFMASALPQYQKDAVGCRVQAMKEELELYDKLAEK